VRDPAVLEMLGQRPDHRLAKAVAGKAAVAKGELPPGRDDVRRIRRDEVEPLAAHRLEQAPLAHLQVVDPVEERVQAGEAERAGVHVGRDDAPRVPCGEQGLEAGARPDVERRLDRLADGQPRQHARRGRRRRKDVVEAGREPPSRLPVPRHQEAEDGGERDRRAHLLAVALEEARRL
jgi:hypothetical protein